VFCVLVTTDKSSYTLGETVLITVKVTANGSPVVGAAVHLEVNTPSGLTLVGNGTTDAGGQVTFSFTTTRQTGRGTYAAAATATSGSYTVTDTTTFSVS
jgi:uncharacterized protein YfaS (alpha-2-macroglobulin family)